METINSTGFPYSHYFQEKSINLIVGPYRYVLEKSLI